MASRFFAIGLTIGLVLVSHPVGAQAEDISDVDLLLSLYGDEDTVALATGEAKPIRLTPATASVITAQDIQATGATNVIEALESVPGLHVSTSAINYQEIFTFRGIFSSTNPQVLVMVNGVPISALFNGNRNNFWGGMPVSDISRIEVLRGPGSAVYGADAFAGVINIITKRADEVAGTRGGCAMAATTAWISGRSMALAWGNTTLF